MVIQQMILQVLNLFLSKFFYNFLVSTGISSSLSESFSDNNNTEDKKTSDFSSNFVLFEGENTDNIEFEYVHEVLVGIKKVGSFFFGDIFSFF